MLKKLFVLMLLFGSMLTISCNSNKFTSIMSVFEDCTGRGNSNELLVSASIAPEIIKESKLKSVSYSLAGVSDFNDIDTLLLTVTDKNGKEIVLSELSFKEFENEFVLDNPYVFSDTVLLSVRVAVSPKAVEGNMLTARISKIKVGNVSVEPVLDNNMEIGGRRILLTRKLLYAPGDFNSKNWRIPALTALHDGSLLAVVDKRKYNELDIPEDIDIVSRLSNNNGKTWLEPVNIAVGTGKGKGFGDAAVMLAPNGDIVCGFIGGNGLMASTPCNPQLSYISISKDGGKTWGKHRDITPILWGNNAVNKQCRNYTASFFASGNGITLKRGKYAGRIMLVAAMRPANNFNNHVVYSDDCGKTWNVSDIAFEGGDEAKVVELVDGRILMSVRRNGERGFNISVDGGKTWGKQGLWPEINTNACNGDMIRLSATDEGGDRNILLHSIPNDMERKRVSIFVSYDEGKSWQDPKLICPGKSVYSSMTILNDGTIGFLTEEVTTGDGVHIWFMNFSKEWLLGK